MVLEASKTAMLWVHKSWTLRQYYFNIGDISIFSPLGRRFSGLMASHCVRRPQLSPISQKLFGIYFLNLTQAYIRALSRWTHF